MSTDGRLNVKRRSVWAFTASHCLGPYTLACHVLWSGQVLNEYFGRLAPVFQKLDSAIHRINRYPMNKYYQT